MLFRIRQALISSYDLLHHSLFASCVWHRQLVTTNDDPEIVRQRPINVRVKLVSILEDESEDSLRHFNFMIHISHNKQYYKCFSGNGKLYFRFLRFFDTMRLARRRLTLRAATSFSSVRSSYVLYENSNVESSFGAYCSSGISIGI